MAKKDGNRATIAALNAAARVVRTELAAKLLSHGFYAGQDQIMLALAERDGLTPGQLASQLGVRPPTVTKTINRLQDQGFVERRASDADGRQSHVHLTDSGWAALAAVDKAVRKTERGALAGLKKRDKKKLQKLLGQIASNLSA